MRGRKLRQVLSRASSGSCPFRLWGSAVPILALALGSAFCLTSACSGGGGEMPADAQLGRDEMDSEVRSGADVSMDQLADLAGECPSDLVLEFFGIDDGTAVEIATVYLIQARVYNATLKVPVAGVEVEFTLSGEGDASLAESLATTNEAGIAEVELATGSTLGAKYTLTASSRCVEPVEVVIYTVAPQLGTIIVNLIVSEELLASWHDLALEAYLSLQLPMCDAVDYANPAVPGILLPHGETSIEIPDAMTNAAYVVFGIARNNENVAVGGGCVDHVFVLPGKSVSVDVTLVPLSVDTPRPFDVDL